MDGINGSWHSPLRFSFRYRFADAFLTGRVAPPNGCLPRALGSLHHSRRLIGVAALDPWKWGLRNRKVLQTPGGCTRARNRTRCGAGRGGCHLHLARHRPHASETRERILVLPMKWATARSWRPWRDGVAEYTRRRLGLFHTKPAWWLAITTEICQHYCEKLGYDIHAVGRGPSISVLIQGPGAMTGLVAGMVVANPGRPPGRFRPKPVGHSLGIGNATTDGPVAKVTTNAFTICPSLPAAL